MARTWTFVTDLALGASRVVNDDGHIAVGNDVLYFYDRLIGGHGAKVWSWDGSTLTDISGTSFPGNINAVGKGICWFKNELYFLWFDPTQSANNRQQIYRYDGTGQTWTLVYSLVSADTDGGVLKMACDNTRIAAQTRSGSDRRLIASLDGVTWTDQTMTGGFTPPNVGEINHLFGIEHYSGYGEILGYNFTLDQVVAHESGNNWAAIGGVTSGSPPFAGYAAGFGFFGDPFSTPTFKLSKSEDWGVTLENPSDAINDGFFGQAVFQVAPDVVMYRYGSSNQAWTYDSALGKFTEDGTTGVGDLIKAFFVLGSTLYAICDGNEIYTGGSVATADRRLYIYRTENKGSTWTSKKVET